jgi:hypothetical protein
MLTPLLVPSLSLSLARPVRRSSDIERYRLMGDIDGVYTALCRLQPLIDLVDDNWAAETIDDDGNEWRHCTAHGTALHSLSLSCPVSAVR